jgi:hypothetical protein
MESLESCRTLASLIGIAFWTRSMIGAKFALLSIIFLGTNLGGWKLTRLSRKVKGIIKGGRTIAMKFTFRAAATNDTSLDTGSPIEANLFTTLWIIGVFIFQSINVNFAMISFPSIGTLASLVVLVAVGTFSLMSAKHAILLTRASRLVLTRGTSPVMKSIKGMRTVTRLFCLRRSITQRKRSSHTFATIKAPNISTLFGIRSTSILLVFKVGFITVFTFETFIAGWTVAPLGWIRITSSTIGTPKIGVIIIAKAFRLVLAKFARKQIVTIRGNGTVAMIFILFDSLSIRIGCFDTNSTMITNIASTIFGRSFAEWTAVSILAQTLHVIIDFGLGPNVVHRFRLTWTQYAHDTHSIILTIQRTVWNRANLEFAMTAFPPIGTHAWIGIVGWKLWIAISPIDTKVGSILVTNLFKGRFAVFSHVFGTI